MMPQLRGGPWACGRIEHDGAALALMLLLMTALTLLGMGVLTLARRHAVAARKAERVLQAGLAAEAGVRHLMAAWPAAAADLETGSVLATGGGAVGATGHFAVAVRRLDRELFVAHSVGTHSADPSERHLADAIWVLDPGVRLGHVAAAVELGGRLEDLGGGVDPSVSPGAAPTGWDASVCSPLQAFVDSVFPSGVVASSAALGRPPLESAWAPDGALLPFDPVPAGEPVPSIGLHTVDALLRVAAQVESTFTPTSDVCASPDPGQGGAECLPVPGIWGADGGAVVSGGAGRGVLAVAGDLVLREDATFAGWVLVEGNLTLEGSARVFGFVQAGGDVSIDAPAGVTASGCAALEALRAEWFRIPLPVPGGPAVPTS
jgi:hypothetical protein